MQFPELGDWMPTAKSLHKASLLLGAMRSVVRDPAPHYLEMAMRIEPAGLSTDELPAGGSVLLDFQRAAMIWRMPTGEASTIPLHGHSQASLGETILHTMAEHGDPFHLTARDGSLIRGLVDALHARHARLTLQEDDLADTQPLMVEPAVSATYAEVLYRVFTATARFRARLDGAMTPIVVWPEHFDLSFLWFATANTSDEAPQMNFGFAPFSDGIMHPYLYAYAYPMPEDFAQLSLPALAQWHMRGWNGVLIPYDRLQTVSDPEGAIEEVFSSVFETLASSLH